MASPQEPTGNLRNRQPPVGLVPDEVDGSSDGTQHQRASERRKRMRETNHYHHNLQKQRGQELKMMIPIEFLERAKSDEGSSRDLTHTLNATRLYLASLIEEKAKLHKGVDTDPQDHYNVLRRVRIDPIKAARPGSFGVPGYTDFESKSCYCSSDQARALARSSRT